MNDIVVTLKNSRKKQRILVIEPEHCKGCGFCVEFCPKQVLALSTTQFNAKGYPYAQPVRPEACIGCALCEMYCPDFAIYLNDRPDERAPAAVAIQTSISEEGNGED